jgi:hypothetical protein
MRISGGGKDEVSSFLKEELAGILQMFGDSPTNKD